MCLGSLRATRLVATVALASAALVGCGGENATTVTVTTSVVKEPRTIDSPGRPTVVVQSQHDRQPEPAHIEAMVVAVDRHLSQLGLADRSSVVADHGYLGVHVRHPDDDALRRELEAALNTLRAQWELNVERQDTALVATWLRSGIKLVPQVVEPDDSADAEESDGVVAVQDAASAP